MILALKTADHTTQIWLAADAGPFTPEPQLAWESGRQLADQLLERLTRLLADRHVNLRDLTGIVIFSGPGSFTSLRIGHTVANALADSLGIPVVGAPNPEPKSGAPSPQSKPATQDPKSAHPGTPAAAIPTDPAWLTAGRAALAAAVPGTPALPHYGSEAHITKPKS
jgi:hypothetical protein